MDKLKEYFYLFLLLLIISVITFYEVYNGSLVFVGGDTLSPISFRTGINTAIQEYNNYPLWFPWIYSGMPSVHSFLNISNNYFPHYLFLLLNNLGVPWVWNFILHLIFGAIGMYSLLRFLNCSKYSSFFSCALFMTLPYMVAMTSFGHGSQVMTASYIPWIILFLFKISKNNNLFNFSIFSLLIGFQLQRGHIQIVYYTWMMIGLFVLCNNFFLIIKKVYKSIEIIKYNLYILFSLFIGFLLSMNIYLPVLNYVSNSTRASHQGGAGIEYATQWSMSFNEYLTLFIPSFFGFGGQLYWGDMPFTDYPNYFGIILFILALLGCYKSKINFQYKTFFLLTIFFSFCLSLGSNFLSFYKVFYNYFPFFDKFRVPAYILIILFFSLLVFSSIGLDSIIKKINFNARQIILFYSCLLIVLIILLFKYDNFIYLLKTNHQFLYNLLFDDVLKIIVLLSIFFIIILYKEKINIPLKYFYSIILILCLYDFLRVNKEIISPENHLPHKKIVESNNYIDSYLSKDNVVNFLLTDDTKFRIFDFLGPQNRWSTFNLENVGGYHPAKLNNYNRLLNSLNKKGYSLWPPGILRLLNVKYVVMPYGDFNHDDFRKVFSGSMNYYGNHFNEFDGKLIPTFIYEYKKHLPRLFFTKQIEYIDDNRTTLSSV